MPAVSVIITVYGVEEYIERCVRALFGQTLEDIEFVFVDDCTPDASMDILARVMDDYPERRCSVKILRNDVNRGQAYSRRVGVEAATGDYLIHCDGDDWPEPEMYARMYFKAKAEDLDMVICRICRVYPDHIEHQMDDLGAADLLKALIKQDIYGQLLNKLVSRKAYERGMVYPVCNVGEDYAMTMQLACNCDSVGYLDETLYNYVIREGSITNTEKTLRKAEHLKDNFDIAFSSLETKGLAGKYRKDIVYTKCWFKFFILAFPTDYYRGVYPEVNVPFLFDNHFTLRQRLGHLTHLLGVHGISKAFVRKRK